jgi:hypothetical protein
MEKEIGITAGAIWEALNTKGELSLAQLKKHLYILSFSRASINRRSSEKHGGNPHLTSGAAWSNAPVSSSQHSS